IDRFSVIPIDALLFTKIDETRTYGPLFTVMGRKKKPISYLTMGQRVPEDIEVATPKRFAELVLN
ncbi:MAG: flagellar biosynthesis protein FlhF, partial [Nitrospiria bacterium]